MPLRSWLTVQETATRMGVQATTVQRWIREGRLPALELGGARTIYRIRETDLDEMFDIPFDAGESEPPGESQQRSPALEMFRKHEVQILQRIEEVSNALSTNAANVLESSSERLESVKRRTDAFREIAACVSEKQSRSACYQRTVELVLGALRITYAAIHERGLAGTEPVLGAETETGDPAMDIARCAIEGGVTVHSENVLNDPRFVFRADNELCVEMSCLAVCIPGGMRPVGALTVMASRSLSEHGDETQFLTAVARLLSVVMFENNPEWLTVTDAAERCSVNEATVRRWIRQDELSVLDLGPQRAGYRIQASELDRYLNTRRRKRSQQSPRPIDSL